MTLATGRWMLICSLAIAMLAGCGGASDHDSDARRTAGKESGGARSALSGPGLLVALCIDATIELRRIDASSGEILASKQIATSYQLQGGSYVSATTSCQVQDRLAARQSLSPDLSRIAVEAPPSLNTNEHHVGFVELASGKFTDLTATLEPKGFGRAQPYDQNPIFSPDTGEIWWYRNSALHLKYDSVDKASEVVTQSDFDLTNADLTIQPGDVLPQASGGRNSPDGTRVAFKNCPLSYEICTAQDSDANLFTLPVDDQESGDALQAFTVGDGQPLDIVTWLDNDRLLIQDDRHGDSNFEVITLGQRGRAVEAQLVLPSNARENSAAVASPDGSQIAFLSSETGGPVEIFTAHTSGDETPPQITSRGDMAAGATILLDWQ